MTPRGHRYVGLYREWSVRRLTIIGLARKHGLTARAAERRLRLAWLNDRKRATKGAS